MIKNLVRYIESLIEVTTEKSKKSTSVIDKQNDYQESISKSLYEVNSFLSENIALNKETGRNKSVIQNNCEY